MRATPKRLMLSGLPVAVVGLLLAMVLTALSTSSHGAVLVVVEVFLWLSVVAAVLGVLAIIAGALAWVVKVGVRAARD